MKKLFSEKVKYQYILSKKKILTLKKGDILIFNSRGIQRATKSMQVIEI